MKKYAVLVGCGTFRSEPALTALRCPPNDVRGLSAVLRAPDAGGFDEVHELVDEQCQAVRVKLNQIFRKAGSDDVVLVYFSGHGKLDVNGGLSLVASDTQIDTLESTSVAMDDIFRYVRNSNSRQVILILDCCYSGAAGGVLARGDPREALAMAAKDQSGLFMITASGENQVAQERMQDDFGLFTKHLIAGIESGAADEDRDGAITIDELYNFVERQVRAESRQQPRKWALGVQGRPHIAAGRKSWTREQLASVRDKLHELVRQGVISEDLQLECLQLLQRVKTAAVRADAQPMDRILDLVEQRITPGEFVDYWHGQKSPAAASGSPTPIRAVAAPKAAAVVAIKAATAETFGPGRWLVKTNNPLLLDYQYDLKVDGTFEAVCVIPEMKRSVVGTWRFMPAVSKLTIEGTVVGSTETVSHVIGSIHRTANGWQGKREGFLTADVEFVPL